MGINLGEIQKEQNFKGLIVGPPGNGKTVLATSFAKEGPLLMLDFDGKVDSAANYFSDNAEILKNVTVEDLSAKLSNDPIETLNKIIDKDLIPQERAGKMNYKTIVLDSITTFSKAVLSHIVKTNPGIKRVTTKQGVQPGMQDYGILRREFQKLIPGLLGLPCNIIMTAHVAMSKDELSGETLRAPVMDGSFSNELPVYFKEVWVLECTDKGQYQAQIKPNYRYKFCRSQIKGLPNPLPLDQGYDSIKQYLN